MFNGETYDAEFDERRLTTQHERVKKVMSDGEWHTLREIHAATRDPEASILAQLGHLRKPRFGAHVVEKRVRGEREHGLYEYRMT